VCASKSGKLDKLSPEQIENNLDLIIASGHVATLIEKGYSSLLIKRGYGYLLGSVECEAIKSELESFKQELIEIFKKKFDAFAKKLNGGDLIVK
jgi:hypothetical protein